MEQELFPGWLPLQIAKHYGFPLSNTGKGQSVAILSMGGKIDMEELNKDFKAMRVPLPTINTVLVNGKHILPEQDSQFSGETHLDVEVIGSICPDSKITIYRGPNQFGLADLAKKAVEDLNSVVSISWGGSESILDINSDLEKVFKEAKEKKITVCVSAGDGGSSNVRGTEGSKAAADGKAHVDYPASSPYVLACGGTELELVNGMKTEVVWNNVGKNRGATGGGVSALFDFPSWQKDAGIDIPSVNNGKKGRVIPDVAGLAAGGDWKIYESDKAKMSGGTSAVAPLWASFITLVNEERIKSGKNNLGFINERLYQLASRDQLFIDITKGNNRPSARYPGYEAKKGFDACSGWGVPIGHKLFKALSDLD